MKGGTGWLPGELCDSLFPGHHRTQMKNVHSKPLVVAGVTGATHAGAAPGAARACAFAGDGGNSAEELAVLAEEFLDCARFVTGQLTHRLGR
jgi:hypothetical protein